MRAAMHVNVIERPTERDDERELTEPRPASLSYLSTAEVAECTCPDWCERDHDRD